VSSPTIRSIAGASRCSIALGTSAAEPSALTVEIPAVLRSEGATFLDAVMQGVGDALAPTRASFVFGEDVGGTYGNAFLLLRPLLEGVRRSHHQLAARRRRGARRVHRRRAGRARPIGEMQFNDFVATGFNQLVNNAAKIRYRWGGSVPMVRAHAVGRPAPRRPYHSQNTEPGSIARPV
jgi:2-oxoisovalerate dehydrogenase E1 component